MSLLNLGKPTDSVFASRMWRTGMYLSSLLPNSLFSIFFLILFSNLTLIFFCRVIAPAGLWGDCVGLSQSCRTHPFLFCQGYAMSQWYSSPIPLTLTKTHRFLVQCSFINMQCTTTPLRAPLHSYQATWAMAAPSPRPCRSFSRKLLHGSSRQVCWHSWTCWKERGICMNVWYAYVFCLFFPLHIQHTAHTCYLNP